MPHFYKHLRICLAIAIVGESLIALSTGLPIHAELSTPPCSNSCARNSFQCNGTDQPGCNWSCTASFYGTPTNCWAGTVYTGAISYEVDTGTMTVDDGWQELNCYTTGICVSAPPIAWSNCVLLNACATSIWVCVSCTAGIGTNIGADNCTVQDECDGGA